MGQATIKDWVLEGNKFYNEGNYIEAAAQYKLAIENKQNIPFAWYNLGNCYAQQKKYNEAIVLFKLNAEHFPNERYIGNLWENLGEAYFLNNQKELAKTNFEKAIALKDAENCYWCENATNRLNELKI